MSEQTRHRNWERAVLEKLALSAIQEQRRSRHWSILFKTLGFLYLFIVLFLAAGLVRLGRRVHQGSTPRWSICRA